MFAKLAALAAAAVVAAAGCSYTEGPVEGRDWSSPSTGMEFVWIPELEIWAGKFEVTNEEYRKKEPAHDSGDFMGHSLNRNRQPVVNVNFTDAADYAAWLTASDMEKLGGEYAYRLPSCREWKELAACGDGREYPWGGEWPPPPGEAGNYADAAANRDLGLGWEIPGYYDGHAATAPVDELWSSPWGLYGVGGNAWEANASDKTGESFGGWRGGSWFNISRDKLGISSVSGRGGSERMKFHGFRLVLSRERHNNT